MPEGEGQPNIIQPVTAEFFKMQPDPVEAYARRNRVPPRQEQAPSETAKQTESPPAKAEPEPGSEVKEPAEAKKSEPEKKAEPKEAEPETKTEELEAYAIEDVAEALGLKPEQINDKLVLTIKGEDGKPAKVTLGDLVKGQLREADYTRKTQKVAEERKAFEAERTKAQQVIQQQLRDLSAVLTAQRNDLFVGLPTREQAVQLQARVAADPNDFEAQNLLNAASATFNARMSKIKAGEEQLKKAWDEEQTRRIQKVNEGKAELIKLMPELKDETKRVEFQKSMRDYLTGEIGFSDAEVEAAFFKPDSIYDHREVLVLRDALKWRALQKNSAETVKKIVVLPKVIKPGSSAGRNTEDGSADVSDARRAVRTSGSFDRYMELQALKSRNSRR